MQCRNEIQGWKGLNTQQTVGMFPESMLRQMHNNNNKTKFSYVFF